VSAPADPDDARLPGGASTPGEGPPLEVPLKGRAGRAYADEMEARASEWMSRAKHGDTHAFDELTRALRQRAFLTARSWVGSSEDALELSQEAFLKTYRARDTYRDGEPFLPWFHRILRNTCFSFLRQSKRLRATSLSSRTEEDEPDWEIEGEEPAPESGVADEEEKRAFWKGFARLSARDREILALRHFQELAYSEIARVLAIPEGTVMSRLFHARARLRTALAPLFPEEAGALEREPPKELRR
jgi:RNA polymerase sigma-70 factor (ECF subfamily)